MLINQLTDLGLTTEEAASAVQVAIAYCNENNISPSRPQRIDSSGDLGPSNNFALMQLLIDKGVFTQEEIDDYWRIAVNDELNMREEAAGMLFHTPPGS